MILKPSKQKFISVFYINGSKAYFFIEFVTVRHKIHPAIKPKREYMVTLSFWGQKFSSFLNIFMKTEICKEYSIVNVSLH
jgi:hypothetical protein